MADSISVGIVGGSGYVGLELLRLLINHPRVSIKTVTSRTQAGTKVGAHHRSLDGLTDLVFSDFSSKMASLDLVFLALPHTESMGPVKELLSSSGRNPNLRIIDLGADFRVPKDKFKTHYNVDHLCPELLEHSVYGCPELFRDQIASASLIANPGCFANCVTLSCAPLARSNTKVRSIKVSAITGSSGSGASPTDKTHHPVRNESISAYNILNHRHVPEIENALKVASNGGSYDIKLVPQSGPISRGIFAVSFIQLENPNLDAISIYREFAAENLFVRLREDTPKLIEVRGSNFYDFSVKQVKEDLVVIGAIDNLVKGASGNGIQCMNIMYGWEESLGLKTGALVP